jgi:hypothetical protein
VAPAVLQPGHPHAEMPHCWQVVAFGVPEQPGTWKMVGGGGKRLVEPQQMRALGDVQSLSEVQAWGQVDEQMPPQQSWLDPAQSESCMHACGQLVACRHRPWTEVAKSGSTLPAVVQQIWPEAMLHCESAVHVTGQSFSAVQIGVV